MIVPMKKIHVVAQKKDIVAALEALRDLGCLHIEHQDPLTGYQLEERRGEVDILEKAIAVIKEYGPKEVQEQRDVDDWTEVVNLNLELAGEIGHYKESTAKRQVLISAWEPWGNFNPRDIDALKEKGLVLRLCLVPKDQSANVPAGVILQCVYSAGGVDYCVALSREECELPFEQVPFPAMSLEEMRALQNKELERLNYAQETIAGHACYLDSLEHILAERRDVLNFEEVESGMHEEGTLAILKGFCPAEACATIEAAAQKEHWAVMIEDPSPDDQVPTLLKNPRPVDLTRPAFDIIEILPGYGEKDVSTVFMVFFTLFFGMLIGDAAYGLIFALATVLFHVTLGKRRKDKTPFYLMYLLTVFTIIWGVLTGTYFGQQWLPLSVKPLVPWLNNPVNVQWLCFTIALVHLSIARLWTARLKLPSLLALGQIGWLLIIWGMYFLANMFVLNKPMPAAAGWFFAVGIPLALFFMVPFKDFAKTVPQEIIPFVLGVIGAGTDIISYIRLYAVGLATVAVADAANAMPAALGAGGIVLLVILHGLNLILAAMAILVHAVRLNVLEFSGHLSLEWLGFRYNPFRKLKQV